MKKRILAFVSSFVFLFMTFGFMPTVKADSWDNDPNNYSYFPIDATTAVVMDYIGSSTLIEIPTVSSNGRTVVEIDGSAFDGLGITGVRIPASVTKIGSSAFLNDTSLTDVEFLGTSQLHEIDDSAFRNTGIASITIPAGVDFLGTGVFFNCASLSSVTFSGTALSEIGASAFSNCTGLTGITLPSSLHKIGAGAFYSSGLTSIAIPDGVADIDGNSIAADGGAFQSCLALQSVTFGSGSQLQTVGDYAFDGCANLGGIAMPSGVTSIGKNAFCGCTSLGSASGGGVNIPAGITSIEESTFAYCTSLQSVVIPAGVTSIGNYAFQNDTALASVTFGPGTEMLGSVGSQAFVSCASLPGITLPDTVSTIGAGAFDDCKGITSFTIPAGVTEISDWVFSGSGLTSITIPANITKCGAGAFYDCDGLKTVAFESGSQLTAIGDQAFYHCNGLTGITLPSGLNSLGTEAFRYDTSLVSVTIPASLASIPDNAFSCTGLTSLTLPEGVAQIGANAFSYCNSLVSISLPGSLAGIGDYAFAADSQLADISLSEGLDSVGANAFYNDINFSEITIPSTVTSLKDNAFNGCSWLQKIYIMSKNASFGNSVFDNTMLNNDASCGIYGYAGSTAETYANSNGINFHAGSVLLKFDSNGGSLVADQLIPSGSVGTKPSPDPTKAGFKLENWFTDSLFTTVFDFTVPITADTTVYAKWISAYTVTYDGNNNTSGTVPTDTGGYLAGDAACVRGNLGNLVRAGYTFSCWNTQADGTGTSYSADDNLIMPANDVTLYAEWTANTYSVSYDANGGAGTTASSSHTYDVSKALTANGFTRPGYTFAGWAESAAGSVQYGDGQSVKNLTSVNGATIHLYAIWTQNIYTVTFNSNGGGAVASQNATYGGKAVKPADPVKTGCGFGGWYREAACQNAWDFNADTVTADVTLYAKWVANAYTVSFDSQGGSSVASQPLEYGGKAARPADPVRTGYAFGGWYREAACQNAWNFDTDTVAGDMTLYAKWTQSTFAIAYNLNGGAAANPASYSVDTPAFTLKNPARKGYLFAGWTGTGLSGMTMSVTIPAGSTGDRSYTAHWATQAQTAYLAGVSLSAGKLSPSFSKTRYSYKITLSEYQGSVTITPQKAFGGASMAIAGKTRQSYTVSVANGKSVRVYVKLKYARTQKTYSFTVTRAKSSNNNLASLTASAGTFNKAFDPAVTGYTLTLGENTKSVKLTCKTAASLARTSFKSKTISLLNGQSRVIKLTVRAQSGKSKTYVITVKRAASTNANLSYLRTGSKSLPLKPAFSNGTASYTVTLPAKKSTVTLYARAAGYKAAIYFNGSKRSSKAIALKPGQSQSVTVKAVAQSGAVKTFIITVARQ